MTVRSLVIGLGILACAGIGARASEAGEKQERVLSKDLVIRASWGNRDPGPARVVPHRRGVRHVHGPHCRYVPGHYETSETRTWVPGHFREEYVPPEYQEFRDRYGIVHRMLVRPGYARRIWVPGHTEIRTERIWIPGRYVCH